MAEDEIIKHTKKAFSVMQSKEHGWLHKLKEIGIEFIIIVFAVTVSIWLHNLSEERQDKKEEREFFIGLKKDLEYNLANISNSKKFYTHAVNGFQFFLNAASRNVIPQDSINQYANVLFSSTDLDPHVSRYEGLKSSGKFRIVENKELLNAIIDLHESTLQRLRELDEKYYRQNEKLAALATQFAKLDDHGQVANAVSVVSRSDFRILANTSGGIIAYNILGAEDAGIKKCRELMAAIDKELK